MAYLVVSSYEEKPNKVEQLINHYIILYIIILNISVNTVILLLSVIYC